MYDMPEKFDVYITVRSCEHGNEFSGSIKRGEFLD
jgi:hypothetical protein